MCRLAKLLALLLVLGLMPAGCRQLPAVGDIEPQADLALIQFESLDDGISGVVYRRVNNLDALISASSVPVLVVFYDRFDPINTVIIPKLEQMADDYKGRLQIVWISAAAHAPAAAAFSVEKLPHFTIVVAAVLKRSLIGYDEQGGQRLEELIEPYVHGDSNLLCT